VIGIVSFRFLVHSFHVLYEYWKLKTVSFSFEAVNATACGQKKAAAQFVIVNRTGGCRDFAGDASQCALLLLGAVCLLYLRSRALGAHGLRINAKLYVGNDRLSEQGIETKEELTAHGLKLFLPGRVCDRHNQSFSVETKWHGLRAQALARDTLPRDERSGFQHLLSLARSAQELRQ
jgi:hypothetical protein